MIEMLSRLLSRPAPRRRRTAVPSWFGSDAAPEEQTELPPRGCGWFDSSHELRAGLVVTEHASPDQVAEQMPLDDWLHLHLGGWRAGAPH
jgi:hypothetical protein